MARKQPNPRFWIALAVVFVLGILPLVLVMSRGVSAGDTFWDTVTGEEALDALLGTLRLSIGTTLLALLIGAPLAWLTGVRVKRHRLKPGLADPVDLRVHV